MKKPTKKALIVVVVLAVVAVVVFLLARKKKATATGDINTIYNINTGQLEPLTSSNIDVASFPLKRGMKNDYVLILQHWIMKQSPSLLRVYGADGSFEAETEQAVLSLFGTATVSLEQFKSKIL